ncbi:MAG: penicillin-binding transpeptidase domain-containing protein [Rhodothermales bacterium]
MYLVLVLIGVLPVLVTGRLIWIYVTESDELGDAGTRQSSAVVTIPALRGGIYDRNGRALVVNTANYQLALDPTIEGFTSEVADLFFDKLSRLTGRPAAEYRRAVSARSSPKYVMLVRSLSEDQKDQVEAWDVPGVVMTPAYSRRYNYGQTVAHVIGHVGSDGMGLDGVELQYNEYLQGIPGRRVFQRDRTGRIKADVDGAVVEPRNGEQVVLTLDLVLQSILFEELASGVEATRASWGTAVAMDPFTGAILGMANVPTYDPNRFYQYSGGARRNRAITDRVEPGSTFKLVTAVAAVEQDVVALADSIETGNGFAVVDGRPLHDIHGYGTLTFGEAIAKSSNIAIAKTAVQLDRGVFYQYARNMGFGQRTWIDLPGEVDGTLKKPYQWSGTSHSSISIGYEVDVTPLQILSSYAALANGGVLMRPYVVAERRDSQGRLLWSAEPDSIRRAFSRETARRLLPAFEEVVETGTARSAHIEGLRIAGKTGTARVLVNGQYDNQLHRVSYVGFFPADKPEVAILLMLAEPRQRGDSGVITAPIFQRIARRWVGSRPDLAEQLVADLHAPRGDERSAPRVVGLPVEIAASRLRSAGFDVREADDAAMFRMVSEQTPAPGELAYAGARASLRAVVPSDSSAAVRTMPDLVGLSLRQAVHWLDALQVDVRIEGDGMVVSQSPAAGQPLVATAVVRCR